MPVSKSAKKALRTATRRHEENLLHKSVYKKAIKTVKKAVEAGTDNISQLFSEAQSALDKAAKKNTIHPNKAARLKSRLSKKLSTPAETPAKSPAKKATTKKTTTKKSTSKAK